MQSDDHISGVSYLGPFATAAAGGFCNAIVDATVQYLEIHLKDGTFLEDFNKTQCFIAFLAGMASGGLGAISQICSKATKIQKLIRLISIEAVAGAGESISKQKFSGDGDIDLFKTIFDVMVDLISRIFGFIPGTDTGEVLLTALVKGDINSKRVLGNYIMADENAVERNMEEYRKSQVNKWEFEGHYFFIKVDEGYEKWMVVSKRPNPAMYKKYESLYFKKGSSTIDQNVVKKQTFDIKEKLKNGITEFEDKNKWYLLNDGTKYFVQSTYTRIGKKSAAN